MAQRPRVTTTRETKSGRNVSFHDNCTGADMSRGEFVRAIEQRQYPKYHVRCLNGLKTPASNPNGRICDNLD